MLQGINIAEVVVLLPVCKNTLQTLSLLLQVRTFELRSGYSFNMPKITHTLFHLAVLCDSLRRGAYGTFCYGIS